MSVLHYQDGLHSTLGLCPPWIWPVTPGALPYQFHFPGESSRVW